MIHRRKPPTQHKDFHCGEPWYRPLGSMATAEEWPAETIQETGGITAPLRFPQVLTEAQVLDIRRRYAAGDVLYKELAYEYGVSVAHIAKIVRQERRTRLEGRRVAA